MHSKLLSNQFWTSVSGLLKGLVARVYRQCWEKAGIDLVGAKKRAAKEATDLDFNLDLGGEESSGASGSRVEWS